MEKRHYPERQVVSIGPEKGRRENVGGNLYETPMGRRKKVGVDLYKTSWVLSMLALAD